jgi:hypothetical protein
LLQHDDAHAVVDGVEVDAPPFCDQAEIVEEIWNPEQVVELFAAGRVVVPLLRNLRELNIGKSRRVFARLDQVVRVPPTSYVCDHLDVAIFPCFPKLIEAIRCGQEEARYTDD